MPPSSKSSGLVVPQPLAWPGRLAARLIHGLVRASALTLRFSWNDQSGLFDSPPVQPVIYCLWHNRLALCLILFRDYAQRRQPARRLAAMVSASKDGGLLARVLELFEARPVRGSTSRRGPQALLELTSWAERGFDLAITPDGPRGPRYQVQEGIIALAQITGLPIIPVTYYLSWKKCMSSWDQFQIPLPLARCEVVLGEPLRVPREAADAEREVCRRQLELKMRTLTRD